MTALSAALIGEAKHVEPRLRAYSVRQIMWGLVLVLTVLPQAARASCNLIPQTSKTFDSVLGSTNRPFAAPGEPLELRRRVCDPGGAGFADAPANYVVTVVFTPTGGPRNVLVLAASCSGVGTCNSAASTRCVPATIGTDFDVVIRDNERRLSVRFPDTDALVDAVGDGRTYAGPATIAVTKAGDPLPCGLVSGSCKAQGGVVACIDDFFANDGACGTGTPHGTFDHFTALPPPNDFQQACFDELPPCNPTATEFRMTTDQAGNVLIPMDWRGILVRQADVPMPRLLRATIAPSIPERIPGRSFVASYTPEGGLLPPIFEPEADPNAPSGVATLFGSADAPYTILRIARRSEIFAACSGGANDGLPCNSGDDCPSACVAGANGGKFCAADTDCPTSTCGARGTCGATTCAAGLHGGQACNSDANCPGSECGPALVDVRLFGVHGVGPVVIPRVGAGVCQANIDQMCTTAPNCSSGPCVEFALAAQLPVPLEGLAQTNNVFAFALNEGVEAHDLNGDGDTLDTVVTLRDRATGVSEPIGTGGAVGRAVVRTQQPPFSFPALATEGTVVAFLEPELSQGNIDANGNGQVFETLLRVFRLDSNGPTDLTNGLNQAVDGALSINGRSLAVSNGKVFFRTPESASVTRATTRISVADNGAEANDFGSFSISGVQLSADGRYATFTSTASNLVTKDPVNYSCSCNAGDCIAGNSICPDVFVRDRLLNTTEIVSLADDGSQGNFKSFVSAISADGRYVAFESGATNLVAAPDANGTGIDVYVRDRVANHTVRVSVASDGTQGNSHSYEPAISADGRFVAFVSNATNLVAGDTNGAPDVFLHDRDADGNGIFDEPGGISTIRVSVDSNGTEANQGVDSNRFALSADGRVVAFMSASTNLVPNDTNGVGDVFVHDRVSGVTERVSIASDGSPANYTSMGNIAELSLSADGRFVAFSSGAGNLAPGLLVYHVRVFVRDRVAGTTEVVSRGFDGTDVNSDSNHVAISADGRFVVFDSSATNLVPNDTNTQYDVFLYDRVTGITTRLDVGPAGLQADGGAGLIAISADGRFVGFASDATNLLGTGNDTNGVRDAFVRGPGTGGADLNGDGDLDDTVLQVLDASTPPPSTITTVAPADDVAVTAGTAAFLRPESAGAPGHPSGIDLNNDGDTTDDVVHYWSPGTGLQNLSRAATAVMLAATCVGGTNDGHPCTADADCPAGACAPAWIGALVSEAGENHTDLNNDGDKVDTVVEIHHVGDPLTSWTNIGQAADVGQLVNPLAVFITPESAQGNTDLNGDKDLNDRVLQVYDLGSGKLTNVGQAAEEFVVGSDTIACGSSPLIAFRTSEAAQGNTDLNGDGDTNDYVLQVYAKGLGLINTHQAVLPCRLDACDPRQPYRVFGSKVKFLTRECDQHGPLVTPTCPGGGTDLNGNGTPDDIVLQVYDACPRTVTTVGAVDPTAGTVVDPLAQPDPPGPTTSQTAVFVTPAGRCVAGATTLLVPASCASDTDCPSGATCQADQVVAAPAAAPAHDSLVVPRGPLTVRIANGATAVTKKLTVAVANGDVLPVPEKPGHTVQLSVDPGTCPADMVVGLPDFDSRTAGSQATVQLAGGKTKAATVVLNITSSDFPLFNPLSPQRCTLLLTASTVLAGNVDPTPRNNKVPVEIDVFNAKPPQQPGTGESAIKGTTPVKLTISKRSAATPVTKSVGVKLINADSAVQPVTLSVDQGDCPSGTISVVTPEPVTVKANGATGATVKVTVMSKDFSSPNGKSPGRCTAVLTATGLTNPDPNPTNNSTNLVIDVIDKNDF